MPLSKIISSIRSWFAPCLHALEKMLYVVAIGTLLHLEAPMRATDYSSVDLDDALTRPVLVLTKHPEDYRQTLQASGLTPVFAADMRELGQRLQDQAVSGFVLELDEVWQTRGLQREHLFQLSAAFPLLRVHRAHANDALEFMDKPQDFVSQVLRFFPRRARLAPRAPVVL